MAIIMSGCGGGSGGGSSPVATTTVSGSVLAGPANGAKVKVTTVAGTVVAGPAITAGDGSYTIAIPTAALANDLVFEATSGTFDDEADQTASGRAVVLGTLSAYIAGGSLAGGSNVTIDPSSTIIRKMVAGGTSKAAAEAEFNAAFGFTPDCSVKPAFVNMSTASSDKQRLAGLHVAAFSQLTKDLINDPSKQFELIDVLADDLADGTLDGRKLGAAVSTASGTAIPEDIANRYTTALVEFQSSSLNKTRLTIDKLGPLPFNKTALTTSYRVEYIPGTMAPVQGRTSFRIKLTNLGGGTPAAGKPVSLQPLMHMSSGNHSTPADPVIDNGDGTYTCTVYYVMANMMNGLSMGVWELKVMIGSETASFYPTVAMPMGSTTLAKLSGVSDAIPGMTGAEKRTYYLFNDGLASGAGGSYTFGLFLATKETMMSFPAVKVGSQLKDQTGATWTVNAIAVQVSTDAANWVSATDGGNGHWSAAGLTGLSSGVPGKVYVKVTVNGEQKTTDGAAPSATNGYQSFTVIP
ncbi:hypothetical protein F6V30_09810 [Oryzomonas sagensis]|uniref:Carboxypeptidase regulatory-like domain-containing protein n=1 Tax=Oryzomonas sagensis TaxID=2603857 RepID=A0ABQ6TPB9_9BACT|nr:hypothetical protein [Oryzomonas sagensis]KAB0670434.1 hypothetical protein F6V30_09810 [Oryzomonas sagensis]